MPPWDKKHLFSTTIAAAAIAAVTLPAVVAAAVAAAAVTMIEAPNYLRYRT